MSASSSPPRVTKRAINRSLVDAFVQSLAPSIQADPRAFLTQQLASNGEVDVLVVVESTDAVRMVTLRELEIDARTLAVHGFSAQAKAQARAALSGSGWMCDAVRECKATDAGARAVWAQSSTHLCLGKATAAQPTDGRCTLAEARIKPYTLPLAARPGSQFEINYMNYFEQLDTGKLSCAAHRVVGIREMKGQHNART